MYEFNVESGPPDDFSHFSNQQPTMTPTTSGVIDLTPGPSNNDNIGPQIESCSQLACSNAFPIMPACSESSRFNQYSLWRCSEDEETTSSSGLPAAKYTRMDPNSMDPAISDKERYARENHSEIERKRRNRMTYYINELAEMVPQCASLGRKPDKLTILRMTVSHMKSIRGTGNTTTDGSTYKPSFLTEQELKQLFLEAANGFLFFVSCETSKVIYVADTILSVLNLTQRDWMGNSIFDLIHPEDIDKFKEQLCVGDSNTNGRILDLKSGAVKKDGTHQSLPRVHMGSRRGFICRMRLGQADLGNNFYQRFRQKRPLFTLDGHQYVVVHCTGYVRNRSPQGLEQTVMGQDTHCLVLVGRVLVSSMPAACRDLSQPVNEFTTRHTQDGKFSFVSEEVTTLLNHKPVDLLDKCWWDTVHSDDRNGIREMFEQLLKLKGQTLHCMCRFRSKSGGEWVQFRTSAYTFTNPYSDEFEYIIATHAIYRGQNGGQMPTDPAYSTNAGQSGESTSVAGHWLNQSQHSVNDAYPAYALQPSNDLYGGASSTTPSGSGPYVPADTFNASSTLDPHLQDTDWNRSYNEGLSLPTSSKYPTDGVAVVYPTAVANQQQRQQQPSSTNGGGAAGAAWWINQEVSSIVGGGGGGGSATNYDGQQQTSTNRYGTLR